MIKLSTIIPVYNKEIALRKTLQSIVNHHGIKDDEYECILIDDESTDSCPEICKEFCENILILDILEFSMIKADLLEIREILVWK